MHLFQETTLVGIAEVVEWSIFHFIPDSGHEIICLFFDGSRMVVIGSRDKLRCLPGANSVFCLEARDVGWRSCEIGYVVVFSVYLQSHNCQVHVMKGIP